MTHVYCTNKKPSTDVTRRFLSQFRTGICNYRTFPGMRYNRVHQHRRSAQLFQPHLRKRKPEIWEFWSSGTYRFLAGRFPTFRRKLSHLEGCRSPTPHDRNINNNEAATAPSQLTYSVTPYSRVLLDKLTDSHPVKKFPAFMESEGSLPHSQVPATCPYPTPLITGSFSTNFLKQLALVSRVF
jgi:hypothetical protein